MMTNSTMRRVYANPPIEEGLVQFAFVDQLDWSVTTPGVVFQHLRERYPKDPEQQDQMEASLQIQSESQGAGFTLNRGMPRIIYRSGDSTRLVVLNNTALSVNSLRPYEGWPSLSDRLRDAWATLEKAGYNPRVRSVSTRYINKISIPASDPIDLDDYFTVHVPVSGQDGAAVAAFLSRVESIIPASETKVVVTFASASSSEVAGIEVVNFMLDIDVARACSEPEGWDSMTAEGIANELKLIENAEFEGIITDKCRELFR